jgi:hypothetical protein
MVMSCSCLPIRLRYALLKENASIPKNLYGNCVDKFNVFLRPLYINFNTNNFFNLIFICPASNMLLLENHRLLQP